MTSTDVIYRFLQFWNFWLSKIGKNDRIWEKQNTKLKIFDLGRRIESEPYLS